MRPTGNGAAVVLVALTLSGCEGPVSSGGPAREETPGGTGESRPAGADCEGSSDCPAGQACVGGACRSTRTAVEGELLATTARTELEAGDARAAYETYEAALRAYERADAPVPPSVLCGSAEAALACASAEVPREVAARRADACFRGSLPGDPARDRVIQRVVAMRHEGLDLSAFDEPDAPAEFLTAPRRRPDPGAVQVQIELTGAAEPGSEEIDARLRSAAVVQAAVACFLEDWELHHRRSVEASLPIRVSSLLRDMGEYDVYEARVAIGPAGVGESGFAPCVARALEPVFAESFRMPRAVAWEAAATVRASAR